MKVVTREDGDGRTAIMPNGQMMIHENFKMGGGVKALVVITPSGFVAIDPADQTFDQLVENMNAESESFK